MFNQLTFAHLKHISASSRQMEMVCSMVKMSCRVRFNPCSRCGSRERGGEESVNMKVEAFLVCDYAVKLCMSLL